MKVAVISDIHGNYKAFEVFLDYIAEATRRSGKTLADTSEIIWEKIASELEI